MLAKCLLLGGKCTAAAAGFVQPQSAVSESADQSITEQNIEVITIAANLEESISGFPYFRQENVLDRTMGGFWDQFRTNETEEERVRRENAALDKKIAEKELEIKMIKTKLQERKQTRFNKRMRKRLAVVKEVNIDGLVRTSDRYKII